MTTVWKSQVCPPEGAAVGEGISKQLGKPSVDPPTTLVRESVQNSWDAQRGDAIIDVTFRLDRLGAERSSRWTAALGTGLSPASQIALRPALSEDSYILTISDRGTRGLGGPLRADTIADPHVHADFVQFLRNVGEASDHAMGGGTYGFGKGILYNCSAASTIIVDTHCVQDEGAPRRLMGAALGPKFNDNGVPYTGRHWFGELSDDEAVIDPLTGADAEWLSAHLGMPGFPDGDFGTDIAIVGFRLGKRNGSDKKKDPTRTPQEALDLIIRSIAWNLWPKMGSAERPEQIRFHAYLNGSEVPIPRPEDDPALRQFSAALDAVAAGNGTALERKTVQPNHLGDLELRLTTADLAPGFMLAGEGCPITAPLHHVCRMRQAELVVDYWPGEPHPNEHFGYAGVFRSSVEADRLFAESEPPTHDSWTTSGNSSAANRAAMTCRRLLRKNITDAYFQTTRTSRPANIAGLGSIAAGLSPLLAGIPGTGASLPTVKDRPEPARTGRSGPKKPTIKVLSDPRVRIADGGPVVSMTVRITPGSRPSVITAFEEVVLDGGEVERLNDGPARSAAAEVLDWTSADGEVTTGPSLSLDARVSGEWTINARFLPDCAVRIRTEVEQQDA